MVLSREQGDGSDSVQISTVTHYAHYNLPPNSVIIWYLYPLDFRYLHTPYTRTGCLAKHESLLQCKRCDKACLHDTNPTIYSCYIITFHEKLSVWKFKPRLFGAYQG